MHSTTHRQGEYAEAEALMNAQEWGSKEEEASMSTLDTAQFC